MFWIWVQTHLMMSDPTTFNNASTGRVFQTVLLTFCGSQVPPDFYIPDFDEDEQNPDERIDRKEKEINY